MRGADLAELFRFDVDEVPGCFAAGSQVGAPGGQPPKSACQVFAPTR